MNAVVIFSGTTEGRVLSDLLAGERIRHTVCVAGSYGREMMKENGYAAVRVGRMDAEEMAALFTSLEMDKEGVVVDATHPYAAEVTANIKKAAGSLGIRTIRVVREEESGSKDGALMYADLAECADAMDRTTGNILLTTGSKELSGYSERVSEDTRARSYVRVLPTAESLKLCEAAGIQPEHIIAAHGPFSRQFNEAVIRQYEIRHLVTKDSGAAGGFREKREAAAAAGAQLHVIARPSAEEGVSVGEAFRLITGRELRDAGTDPEISLVGIGMGSEDCRTEAAERALRGCDAVFGAERLLQDIACPKKYAMYRAGDIIPVMEREGIRRAAVVFSGDTGFYSGAKAMIRALKEWRSDLKLQVIPGISSYAYLAAKLGESYEDVRLFSIHGKNTDRDLMALTDEVRYRGKVFVLLSGAGDVPEIAKRLIGRGIRGRMFVGTDLSYEKETIRELNFEQALSFEGGGIACALIVNEDPERRPLIHIKRDSEFIRTSVPMTKECVRHESILRLGLREGDVFFDIGGGTGSVAIEAASLSPGLTVYTVEKKSTAAELIRENILKAGLYNVNVVEGEAAEVLPGMPKPDCVFIGGSGGKLREIIGILHSKGGGIRFVINAVSLETIEEAREAVRDLSPSDAEIIMMSVSDIQKAGSYHMLRAQNPVFIFSFTV